MRSRLAATLVLMIIVTVALAGCLDRLPGLEALPDPPGGGSGCAASGRERTRILTPASPAVGEGTRRIQIPIRPRRCDDPSSGTGVVD